MSSTPQSVFTYWAGKNLWTILVGVAVFLLIGVGTWNTPCIAPTRLLPGATVPPTVGSHACTVYPTFLGVSDLYAPFAWGAMAAFAAWVIDKLVKLARA